MPRYTRLLFGMYGGEETAVTLEAENEAVGILIDRFGKDISIIPIGEDRFKTTVHAAVSGQFLGWIMALGGRVRITGPEAVVEKMRAELQRLSAQYAEENRG